ncbi:MAG: hypothetical protein ABIE84_00365, partial [bacterium]
MANRLYPTALGMGETATKAVLTEGLQQIKDEARGPRTIDLVVCPAFGPFIHKLTRGLISFDDGVVKVNFLAFGSVVFGSQLPELLSGPMTGPRSLESFFANREKRAGKVDSSRVPAPVVVEPTPREKMQAVVEEHGLIGRRLFATVVQGRQPGLTATEITLRLLDVGELSPLLRETCAVMDPQFTG